MGQAATGGTGTGAVALPPKLACPDRQDQVPGDPYSPPCVSFAGNSGNNGGATSKGVTGDTIKVSFRVLNEKGFQQTLADLAGASLVDSPSTTTKTVTALADYFNQRFQFYGRKIKIVFFNGQGSNTNELLGGGRDKAEADAITVAEQIGAFADLSATSEPYAGALAKRKVLGFGDPYLSRAWHVQPAPVHLEPGHRRLDRLRGGCRLPGQAPLRQARRLRGRQRRRRPTAEGPTPQVRHHRPGELLVPGVGAERPGHHPQGRQATPGSTASTCSTCRTMSNQATEIIAKMKSQNITTIVCGCDPIIPVFLSGVANREKYFPEFIIIGTALTDAGHRRPALEPELRRPRLRRQLAQRVPAADLRRIGYAAYKSVRQDEPAFWRRHHLLPDGHDGDRHPDGRARTSRPTTFQAGHVRLPAQARPAGLWEFGPGDFTAANDVREICWDPNAVSTYNGKHGAYLGTSNQRWNFGQIPAGDPGVPVPK